MTARFKHCTIQDPAGQRWVMPPHLTQEALEGLAARFVSRPSDVFIVSYPKSGTHWMKQIVHLLSHGGGQGSEHLEATIPFLDVEAAGVGGCGLEAIEAREGRRYLHSHLPVSLLPGRRGGLGRVIYVSRNPKDVATSYYHFAKKYDRMGFEGSWGQFFELFLRGGVQYGSVFDHVGQWWREGMVRDDVLFVKYEDMHADLAAVITEVARFLEIRLTPALLEAVVAQSRFQSMQGNDKANGQWIAGFERSSLLRKGRVGDWRRLFSAAQSDAVDALCADRLDPLGLHFDFGISSTGA